MATSEDLIRNARAATSATSGIPRRKQAVVTCMDARVDPWRLLNAGVGDIHVIRNAGGLVTPDAERSLVASQRKLETTRIDVIMHTRCGMFDLDEDELNAELVAAGASPMKFGSFDDLEAALRRSVALLRSNPALPHRNGIRGYLYDLDAGALRLVIDA